MLVTFSCTFLIRAILTLVLLRTMYIISTTKNHTDKVTNFPSHLEAKLCKEVPDDATLWHTSHFFSTNQNAAKSNNHNPPRCQFSAHSKMQLCLRKNVPFHYTTDYSLSRQKLVLRFVNFIDVKKSRRVHKA